MAGGLLFQRQEQSHETQIFELGDRRCGGNSLDAAVNRLGPAQPFGSTRQRFRASPPAGASTSGSCPGTSIRTPGLIRFFRL